MGGLREQKQVETRLTGRRAGGAQASALDELEGNVLTIYEIDHPEVLSLKVSAVRRLICFDLFRLSCSLGPACCS